MLQAAHQGFGIRAGMNSLIQLGGAHGIEQSFELRTWAEAECSKVVSSQKRRRVQALRWQFKKQAFAEIDVRDRLVASDCRRAMQRQQLINAGSY